MLEDGLHWTGCSRTSTPAARQSGTADTPSHLHINRRVGGPFPCKLDLVSTSSYFREVKKRIHPWFYHHSMTGWFFLLSVFTQVTKV